MLNHLHALLGDLPIAALRLLAWLLVAALIFMPLERGLSLRQQTIPRSQWLADIGWYFLSGLLPAFLLLFTTLPINALSRLLLPQAWLATVAEWPRLLAVVLTVVVGDFAYYWAHRWSHEWPGLWCFHVVHHQPKQVYWLVNTRVHPIDAVYTRTLVFVPVCLLGLSQAAPGQMDWIVLGAALFNRVWSTFVHANVRIRLGAFENWFSSPRFHHWHHADEQVPGPGKNYAALLPLWDRLFGTEHPMDRFPHRYGVSSESS